MRRSTLPRLLMLGLMLSSPGQWAPRGWAQAPAARQPNRAQTKPAQPKPSRPRPAKPLPKANPSGRSRDVAEPLDLKYISSDFIAASVGHPRRTLSSPQFQLFPVEITQATTKQELGVDIMQVEDLITLFAFNPAQPPSPSMIARFNEPLDREAIVSQVSAGAGEKIGGLDSYPLKRADLGSVVFPDDRTALVGHPAQLAKMLAAENETSPLIERLRHVDRSEMASAVALLDPWRPIIQVAMAQLGNVPPPFQPFLEVPGLVSAVELHLASEGGGQTSLVLEGTDEKAAARLAELLEDAIGLGTDFLDGQLDELKAREPGEIADATEHYAHRILKRVLDAVHRERDGKRLVLSIEGGGFELTSISTIGILIALLLPAVQAAREAARRSQSNNNLRQIGLAMQSYADVHKNFPARAIFKDGKPLLSWRVAILPYIEQMALYKQFHLDEPWDSEHNRTLIEQMPQVYANPALDAKLTAAGMTDYLAPAGPNTAFNGEQGLGFASFKDGTSNTIIAIEANADRSVIWTKPDDLEVDAESPVDGLGSIHPGGFMALFADGHTRFISGAVDLKLLLNLFNPRDGQVIPNDF
jgi:prepilin-type processing-associated H-X9-DG protein